MDSVRHLISCTPTWVERHQMKYNSHTREDKTHTNTLDRFY
eukprot:UN16226